jgi:hypothetical protein
MGSRSRGSFQTRRCFAAALLHRRCLAAGPLIPRGPPMALRRSFRSARQQASRPAEALHVCSRLSRRRSQAHGSQSDRQSVSSSVKSISSRQAPPAWRLPRSRPSLRNPSFSTSFPDAMLSGLMKACTRCKWSSLKQKSRIADTGAVAMVQSGINDIADGHPLIADRAVMIIYHAEAPVGLGIGHGPKPIVGRCAIYEPAHGALGLEPLRVDRMVPEAHRL